MAIFVIFKVSDPAALRTAILTNFPADHFDLGSNEWLISGRGTAQEISDRLGLSTGVVGSGIIFSMQSYYGRASSNIWDWIKTKSEQADG